MTTMLLTILTSAAAGALAAGTVVAILMPRPARRGRQSRPTYCGRCDRDVADAATHLHLVHRPRPLGCEDRADWRVN